MTDVAEIAGRYCYDCRFAKGDKCARGRLVFDQRYERHYSDLDFCGPQARYFQHRSPWRRFCLAVRAYLENSREPT